MATDVEVCRNALLHLGENEIQSLDEENDAANTCKNMYPAFRLSVFAGSPWNFARTRVQLARLVTAPVNQWTYAYQVPPDVVRPEAVYNSTSVGARSTAYGWERVNGAIETDFSVLVLKYIALVNEGNWPGAFTIFMEYAFAAHICMAVTGKRSLRGDMMQMAYGMPNDNMRGGQYAVAKHADAAADPGDVIEDYTLIDSRWGGDAILGGLR